MCKYLDFIKDDLNSNLINATNNLRNRNIATKTDVNSLLSENHEELDNGFSVTYHSDDNHYLHCNSNLQNFIETHYVSVSVLIKF